MLAFAAASLAGFVDAVGFLSANGYFVSFMSGNTTRLAVDLATQPLTAVLPALLIAGFISGVAAGTVIAQKAGMHRKPAVFGAVAIALAMAGLLRWSGSTGASLGVLVIAMGAINTSFQRDGSVAVGVTYMTGALVRLGEAIGAVLCGQRPGSAAWAQLVLWSSLASGAFLGAWAGVDAPHIALGLAACWAGLLTLAAWRLVRTLD